MDSNVNVVRWGSEELSIPYISPKDNKVHKYYPDFIAEVKTKEGNIETFLIEVKPKKQTIEPKRKKTKSYISESITYKINTSKWEAASKFCQKEGWKFIILTEEHLFPKGNK